MKLVYRQKPRTFILLTWNQKNLDYEIETAMHEPVQNPTDSLKSKEPRLRDWNETDKLTHRYDISLEIKRTSITRLKLIASTVGSIHRPPLKSKEPRLRDWNISPPAAPPEPRVDAWNQKNLDYEIET